MGAKKLTYYNKTNHYYLFGMLLPNRHENAGEYRYGFGGHEKDDEIKGSGNIVDMGDRWLDVRLGRTPKSDRKAYYYPDISPYAYVGNNPIRFTDPNGETIVDPQTGKPVVKVGGEWKSVKKVAKDGTITYGTVSDKFNTQTKPYLDVLEKSEVGRSNIEYMQTIPTLITIDPSIKDPKSGDASTVQQTGAITKDGYYKSVNIIPDNGIIKQNADAAGISVEEKTSGVLSVEVGHLKPEQIAIEGSSISFSDIYNGLLNGHIRAQISYREENGIELDDSLFKPLDKLQKNGFKLDPDLQKVRDNLKSEKKD